MRPVKFKGITITIEDLENLSRNRHIESVCVEFTQCTFHWIGVPIFQQGYELVQGYKFKDVIMRECVFKREGHPDLIFNHRPKSEIRPTLQQGSASEPKTACKPDSAS